MTFSFWLRGLVVLWAQILLALFGLTVAGCTIPNMAEAFGVKPQKLSMHKNADGSWSFDAGTDFDGSGELIVDPRGGYTFRVFNWKSMASPVTLAQGEAAAKAGLQEAMKEHEETRRAFNEQMFGTINRVVDMVPMVAPLFVKPPPAPEPPGPTIPPVVLPFLPGGFP